MKFTRIIVETSPFVRCLMTSAQIAKALGIPSAGINYRFCEWLTDWLYRTGNPIPKLEFKNKALKDLNVEYGLQGIKFEDTSVFRAEASKLWPEGELDDRWKD